MSEGGSSLCPWCSKNLDFCAEFPNPLPGENIFSVSSADYHRTILYCEHCELYLNKHDHAESLTQVYRGSYKDNSYGREVNQTFQRIMSLPDEKSSNRQRVQFLLKQLEQLKIEVQHILDVGSGMGVFCAAMQEKGYVATAVDVDPSLVEHMKHNIGVHALCGEFLEVDPVSAFGLADGFDLISFNKVLEHVPVQTAEEMLIHAQSMKSKNGVIYLELPDGHGASRSDQGFSRQEFFLEHYVIYTKESLNKLADRSGLNVLYCEKLQEVNDKYTVRAILQ